jgi:hypothetical protein
MFYVLIFQQYTFRAFFAVSFERFTQRRLTCIPGNVKLYESPRRAEGLPVIINNRAIQLIGGFEGEELEGSNVKPFLIFLYDLRNEFSF